MNIDKAIFHCIDKSHEVCGDCAKEHEQLAEWLIELKEKRIALDEAQTKLKPTEPSCVYSDEAICPFCSEVIDESDSYIACMYCGQIIDWRDW